MKDISEKKIIEVGNKTKKRCSSPLAIKDMSNKAPMRYHYMPIRMAKMTHSDNRSHGYKEVSWCPARAVLKSRLGKFNPEGGPSGIWKSLPLWPWQRACSPCQVRHLVPSRVRLPSIQVKGSLPALPLQTAQNKHFLKLIYFELPALVNLVQDFLGVE